MGALLAVAGTKAVSAQGAEAPSDAPRGRQTGAGAQGLLVGGSGFPGFVVVELFTSEGCSSCPPSDEVLTRIVKDADRTHLPVYALEWHVDYWDYLGWKDPFDSRYATDRQYAYARALPSSVYTPQTVINGTIVPAYAGDWREVDSTVHGLLGERRRAGLKLSLIRAGRGPGIHVHADVAGAPPDSVLLLAIVEEGLGATPTAGENAGRTLAHSNVVRTARELPAASADAAIEVPPDLDPARSRLIGLIQDAKTMRILGAAQIDLAPGSARLSGRVVDGTGHGAAGVLIQACNGSVCVPVLTDSAGFFVVEAAAAGTYTLAVGGSAPVREVVLAPGQTLSLDPPLVVTR